MDPITIFTENEKKVMRPLLKAKEHGNLDAAIKFTEMWIEGYKRALAEYKKHPDNETIDYGYYTDLFPDLFTVEAQIREIEYVIAESEESLKRLKENK